MTKSETRTLLFLAAVATLGVGVRLVRSETTGPAATVETRRALARQIAAVDSAQTAEERARGGKGGKGGGKGKRAKGGGRAPRAEPPVGSATGGPVGGPATGALVAGARVAGVGVLSAGGPPGAAPLDVDRAAARELEALPGIGPALAARIVADREANGAFGSLEGLDRVRGVGPALRRRLAGRVTFTGVPRPPTAVTGGPSAAPVPGRPRPRRRGRA